jgi:putative Flp pilus-assembly TadE/G-like protein
MMKATRQTEVTSSQARWRGNRGQVITLYAIALPVVLGFCALALDGGKLFVSKIHVQNAADAAALASAQDLGQGQCFQGPSATCDAATQLAVQSHVNADVNSYSSQNGGPAVLVPCAADWYAENQSQRHIDPARDPSKPTGCYTWPYVNSSGPHWDRVEVRIRKPVNLEFAHIVGFSNPAFPFARSVGSFQPALLVTTNPGTTVDGVTIPGQTHTYTTPGGVHTTTDPATTITNTTTTSTFSGGTGGAAFIKSTDCANIPPGATAALHWSGAASTFKTIILNGGYDIPGANRHHADHLYVGKKGVAGCQLTGSGADITAISGPFGPLDWPLGPPSPAPPVGCQTTGTATINSGWPGTHPPGVYCWTSGTLQISANSTHFNGYSFYAPSIGISSNGMVFNESLACGTRKVLFDAYAGDFTMNGGGDTLNGDIYVPNGNIVVTGGGAFAGCGFMEANKMDIGGNFAGYSGTGPGEGGGITTTTNTTTTVIPGGTHTTTDPSSTTVTTDASTVIPGTTSAGSQVTATTSTNIGLGE